MNLDRFILSINLCTILVRSLLLIVARLGLHGWQLHEAWRWLAGDVVLNATWNCDLTTSEVLVFSDF
jgi:hypothetical protein